MKRRAEKTKIARIFEYVGGYFWCDAASEIWDARGHAYQTKAAAMEAAARGGYRYAIGSGTYWDGVRAIPEYIRARAR